MPMTAKRKKRLTYIAIGGLFLLSAIEYAVILPTVWLYIKQRFGAKLYLMGLVLSAFSFAGLIASPIMGKWSDHSKDTKSVLLIANLFEIGGSIMYFLGISGWFLVASRFVAGVGSGVISPLFADISRITTVEERTAVMSSFMAVRQFGLLVGPGFNLVLRELHFYIGPYIVDKYTSPGLFMACVWIAYEFYIIFFYTNLPQLKIELEVEKQQIERNSNGSPFASETHSHEGATVAAQSEDVTVHVTPDDSPVVTTDSEIRVRTAVENNMSGFTSSDDLIECAEQLIQVTERQISKTSVNTSSSKTSFPRLSDGDADSEDSGGILFNVTPSMSGVEQSPQPCHSQCIPSYGSVNNVAPSTECRCWGTNIPPSADHSGCSRIYEEVTGSGSEAQCLDTSHQAGSWRYYYNEHMKEEVVVVLSVVFVAFFNQMALESMVTPLTAKLLHWGELENSLMYCTAGAEILLVFLLIRFLSRHVSDRNLLVTGFVFITISIALLMWFLTSVQSASWTMNLVCLVSVLALDMFGLPFLLVTSTSLYSKMTSAETQGFSQGVRRIVGSLGMIMGPLWVSGLWDHLYIMFGVTLGMNVLVLVMLFLSYHRLVEMEPESEEIAACPPSTERQPLLQNT